MSQAPRVRLAPPAPDTTYGDLAAELAGDYGLTPDPWQRIVLDDWLAVSRNRWSSLTCGLAVPRQNGKNAVIEVRELFGMIGRGEKILHTAHEVKTARKAFKRLQFFFGTQKNDPAAKFPELNARVEEVRNTNGQEAIYLKNGASVEVVARSKNSGRGFTVDVLVMDEAQEMDEADLEALMPTTSAAPKSDPQWIFTGTPPGPTANGEIFTRIRTEALEKKSKRQAWHEWSAAPDDRNDDPAVWKRTNPGLITGRLLWEVVEGERGTFSDEGFGRERLGRWATGSAAPGLSSSAWSTLSDPDADRGPSPVFGVATAPDRSWSAIAVAWWRPDGLAQVMLADYKPTTAWVQGRYDELRSRWGGKVLGDTASRGLVDGAEYPTRAVVDNALDDRITAGTLRHGNQPALNTALRSAKWKPSGDTRVLDRRGSADISPIVAAGLALHGLADPTSGGWMVGI